MYETDIDVSVVSFISSSVEYMRSKESPILNYYSGTWNHRTELASFVFEWDASVKTHPQV